MRNMEQRPVVSWKIYLSTFFLVVLLAITACDGDRKLDEAINARLLEVMRNDAQTSLDLQSVTPVAWEKVCLGYFPYASKSRVEDEYRGKILGEYKVVGDSNWLLLGITANNEITQVVLDMEISGYLANHYRGSATAKSCVSRNQAVFTAVHHEGKRYVHLGKP